MVNIENLIRLAVLVRDETGNKQNTSLRVGGTLLELVNALQEIIGTIGDVDERLTESNTRTRHLKGITNDPDALYETSSLGLYGVWGGGWRGSLSVQFDALSNVSQVALSSSTPSYDGNTLTWLSAKPCVMVRTYTNGSWSQWELLSGGDASITIASDGLGDLDISDALGYVLARFENGHIRTKNFYSGNIYTKSEVDNLIGSGGVTQQQLNTALATKRDTLISGTNIKTINGNSLLGSGDITINKDGNQWKGKKWFAYGTSMTNTSNEGKYATYLTTLSGMIRTNRGFSGGGITTASNQTIYNAIMDDTDGKASADLITLEVGANDASAPLGSLTDYSDNSTFIGALILCIRHLQAVTNAQIVVFPSPTSRYKRTDTSVKYDGTETFGSDSHTILERNEAIRKVCMLYDVPFIAPSSNLGYARCNASNNYNVDQIHHTNLGGYNYALSIWSQLKNIPNFKTSIDL